MSIRLTSVAAICARGQRPSNEDYVYPPVGKATPSQRRFIVCDGVGGSAQGEVASQLTAETINDFFTALTTDRYTKEQLQTAVQTAQQRLSRHVAEQPLARHLATTLTFLQIEAEEILVGHIGDSRIYQFRAGEIIFKTEDHSLVNKMVAEGIINAQQAATHPQRNVITQAIQPLEEGAVEATIQTLTDVKDRDYFLLCTDGILEGFSDEALQDLFANTKQGSTAIANTLQQECQIRARDNFSAYVLQVERQDIIPTKISTSSLFGRTVQPLSLFPFIILFLLLLLMMGHFVFN